MGDLWLEDILGEKALKWVEKEKKQVLATFGDPKASPLYSNLLNASTSKHKVPYVTSCDGYLYGHWTDTQNPRGLWRRTTLEEYVKLVPQWEILLDIDALGREEKQSWVWEGVEFLECGLRDRALIQLSPGGTDATVVREYNLTDKCFVTKDPFIVPLGKLSVCWKTRDILWVGSDFGEGSLTDSGYPRLLKEWKRGTSLLEAPIIFSGETTDMCVAGNVSYDHAHVYEWLTRMITFYETVVYLRQENKWLELKVPRSAEIGTFCDQLLITLRADWLGYKEGSLLAISLSAFLAESHNFVVLFAPTSTTSLSNQVDLQHFLVLEILDTVKSTLCFWKYTCGNWIRLSTNRTSDQKYSGFPLLHKKPTSRTGASVTTSFRQP